MTGDGGLQGLGRPGDGFGLEQPGYVGQPAGADGKGAASIQETET